MPTATVTREDVLGRCEDISILKRNDVVRLIKDANSLRFDSEGEEDSQMRLAVIQVQNWLAGLDREARKNAFEEFGRTGELGDDANLESILRHILTADNVLAKDIYDTCKNHKDEARALLEKVEQASPSWKNTRRYTVVVSNITKAIGDKKESKSDTVRATRVSEVLAEAGIDTAPLKEEVRMHRTGTVAHARFIWRTGELLSAAKKAVEENKAKVAEDGDAAKWEDSWKAWCRSDSGFGFGPKNAARYIKAHEEMLEKHTGIDDLPTDSESLKGYTLRKLNGEKSNAKPLTVVFSAKDDGGPRLSVSVGAGLDDERVIFKAEEADAELKSALVAIQENQDEIKKAANEAYDTFKRIVLSASESGDDGRGVSMNVGTDANNRAKPKLKSTITS